MRKSLTLCLLFASTLSFAQTRQARPDNPDLKAFQIADMRTEINIPDVNGYRVLKADLHSHTVYSDAQVCPNYRVREAWRDGLDILAITDHIEYRPDDKCMVKYLDKGVQAVKGNDDEIQSNLNFPYDRAASSARHSGLLLIRAAEITRDPVEVGHFNALFTKDNNKIYDKDPLQSIRNAKAQGAIIQINHPGWKRPDNEYTEVAKAAIKEGLISGVEIFNTEDFYPNVIEPALNSGFYLCGGTDVHASTAEAYSYYGYYRDMTLILAKDNTEESVREALLSGRTLAYGYGDIAGSEQLLKDFFRAAVSVDVVYVTSKKDYCVRITNKSAIPFIIRLPGRVTDIVLQKYSSARYSTKKAVLPIQVKNLWFGEDKHPEVVFSLAEQK